MFECGVSDKTQSGSRTDRKRQTNLDGVECRTQRAQFSRRAAIQDTGDGRPVVQFVPHSPDSTLQLSDAVPVLGVLVDGTTQAGRQLDGRPADGVVVFLGGRHTSGDGGGSGAGGRGRRSSSRGLQGRRLAGQDGQC